MLILVLPINYFHSCSLLFIIPLAGPYKFGECECALRMRRQCQRCAAAIKFHCNKQNGKQKTRASNKKADRFIVSLALACFLSVMLDPHIYFAFFMLAKGKSVSKFIFMILAREQKRIKRRRERSAREKANNLSLIQCSSGRVSLS